jgi:peptidoglycan biosynthesis protein MviN/MurJ (putative lipid II flippase)
VTLFRRVALITMGGLAGTLMLGLVQLRAGALFGAGGRLDAFVIGAVIPSVFLALSASVITQVLTPRLSGRTDAHLVAGRAATSVFIVGCLVGGVAIALGPLLVQAVSPSAPAHTHAAATSVLRVYAIAIGPTLMASVYGALGFANGRVWVLGTSSTLYAATWFALLFIGPFESSPTRLALAGVVATAIQLTTAFAAASMPHRTAWPRMPLAKGLHATAAVVGAMLVAALLARANLVLDPIFGSQLARGSVSELAYAYRIALLLVIACGQGVGLAMLALPAHDARSTRARTRAFTLALMIAAGAIAPIAIAFKPITEVVLGRGNFTSHDAGVVGSLVEAYGPTIALLTVAWALEAYLFATRRTRAVIKAVIAAVLLNLVASFALVPAIGVYGRPVAVALASSVYLAALLRTVIHEPTFRALRWPRTLGAALLVGTVTAVSSLAAEAIGRRLGLSAVGTALLVIGSCLLVGIPLVLTFAGSSRLFDGVRLVRSRSRRQADEIGWLIVVPATAILLGAAIPARESVWVGALLIVTVSGLITLAVVRPKILVAGAVVATILGPSLVQLLHLPRLGLVDDLASATIVVVLPMVRLARGHALRGIFGGRWFALYACVGVAGCLINSVSPVVGAEGTWLALKGVAFGFAVAQVNWSRRDFERLARYGGAAIGVVLLASIVNLAVPVFWSQHLSLSRTPEYRFGFPSLIGPFTWPGDYGHVIALGGIAIYAYRLTVRRSVWTTVLLIGSAIGCLLSVRRKAIAGLVTGLVAVDFTKSRIQSVLRLILIVPVVGIIAWSSLQAVTRLTRIEYFSGHPTAREILYRDSIRIATTAFPWGEGFGRFGTHTAVAHYSPVYTELGYPAINGLSPSNPHFASDAFWPGVLGETGLLGFLAFAAGLVAIFRQMRRMARGDDVWLSWLGLVGVGWSIEFLVESTASSAYVGPPGYGLFFGLAGFATAIAARERTERERVRSGALPQLSPA